MRSRTAAVLAAAFVAVGVAAGPAAADPANPVNPGPAPGPGPGQPVAAIDHDGTYAVGSEIAPGSYRSAGPADGHTCYWKRSRDGAIVDNAMSKKPQAVQIEPTDTEFRTSGCQPWLADGAPVTPGLDPVAAQNELRGFVDQLNLGSLLHGGPTVPRP